MTDCTGNAMPTSEGTDDSSTVTCLFTGDWAYCAGCGDVAYIDIDCPLWEVLGEEPDPTTYYCPECGQVVLDGLVFLNSAVRQLCKRAGVELPEYAN